jgi:hypothetical protein
VGEEEEGWWSSRVAGRVRPVRLVVVVGMARLSRRRWDCGGGLRDESESLMSSVTRSSVSSESEVSSTSDMTRGDPTNGASRLSLATIFKNGGSKTRR